MKDETPALAFLVILGFVAVAFVVATNPTPSIWQDAAEITRTAGPLATAAAAWAGALVAVKGLQKWREEARGKRKAELAEQVLAGFYEVKDVIAYARSPFVRGYEMEPEPGVPETKARDSSYAPAVRLFKERQFLSEFRAHRYAFAAVFGTKEAGPFEEINKVHNQIVNACDALFEHKDWDDEEGRKFRQSMKRIAFNTTAGTAVDPIEARVEAAVKAIEDICRPAIEAREKP